MVGGGSRKDEPIAISNTNVFAALGNLNKKKKEGSSKKAGSSKKEQVFWAPAPLTMKSWADVDDEDDDDYYATTAPPPSVWPPAADDGVDLHNVKGIQLQLRTVKVKVKMKVLMKVMMKRMIMNRRQLSRRQLKFCLPRRVTNSFRRRN